MVQGIAAAAGLLVCLGLASSAQSGKVKIGWGGPLKDIEAAKGAGFDYFEVRTTEVAALSDADFEKAVARLHQVNLPVLAAYQFFPGDIKITGPNVDPARQMAYLRPALDRMARLGVHVIVFGSGTARQFPEGYSKKEAFAQLVGFGKRVGPEARSRGITIAIEPQRPQECNIVNTASEALEWVEAVKDPNIQLMIDYYHFSVVKEDPAIIAKVKDHLVHLHMANPDQRVMPLRWEEYDYGPFFAALRQIRYDRLIGLEAATTNLAADGPRTIALLRHAFEQ